MIKRLSPLALCFKFFSPLIAIVILGATASLAQTTGTVYVNTNQVSNQIWSYLRAADGTLTFAGSFSTQGSGSGGNNLGSQGSVILSRNHKFLFVANAGSSEITSFAVNPGGQLTFVSKVASGGQFPNSLTNFGNLLYALNAKGTANIRAFRVSLTGVLRAISNSTRGLSTDLPAPAQVGFSNDGKLLVVAEIATGKIDTYTVGTDGRATGPLVQNSAGPGPFGFAFDRAGHLIVSEVTNSGASSYSVSQAGVLTPITSSLLDFGKAACWVVNTNSPAFPNQYSYITNTADDTISGFRIGNDGSLSLLDPDGRTFVLPTGADPLDETLSRDSRFLYVLEGLFGGVVGFRIQTDGSLVQVTSITGTPVSSYGLIGN